MLGLLAFMVTGVIAGVEISNRAEHKLEKRKEAKEKGEPYYIAEAETRATSTNERVYVSNYNNRANGHSAVVGIKSGKVYKDYSVEACRKLNKALADIGCPFRFKEVQVVDRIGFTKPYWVPYNHFTDEYFMTKTVKLYHEPYHYQYVSLGKELKDGFQNNTFGGKRITAKEYVYYGGLLTSTAFDAWNVVRTANTIDYTLNQQKYILERKN